MPGEKIIYSRIGTIVLIQNVNTLAGCGGLGSTSAMLSPQPPYTGSLLGGIGALRATEPTRFCLLS